MTSDQKIKLLWFRNDFVTIYKYKTWIYNHMTTFNIFFLRNMLSRPNTLLHGAHQSHLHYFNIIALYSKQCMWGLVKYDNKKKETLPRYFKRPWILYTFIKKNINHSTHHGNKPRTTIWYTRGKRWAFLKNKRFYLPFKSPIPAFAPLISYKGVKDNSPRTIPPDNSPLDNSPRRTIPPAQFPPKIDECKL